MDGVLILTEEECIKQFYALPIEAKQWMVQIALELNKAIEKHPMWPRDNIHAAAIVCEESGELIRAALQQRYGGGQVTELAKEAKQTGAMCLRLLLNLTDKKQY